MIPAIVGGAASLIGGLFGAGASSNAASQARQAYEKSVKDLEAIGIPTVEAQQMTMEEYKSQGQWTPELEQSISLGDSQMGGITTDPAYKESQLKALGKLKDIGDSGGMQLEDRATQERIEGGINARQRGSREAILQDAQQRGGYGSGTSLVAQLMSQQGGSQDAHMAGLNTAASAQKRALEAIKSGGDLGTQLRGQEFGEKQKVAEARDAISKWNASNSQDVAQRNAGVKNTSAQYNLSNAQNLANSNVDTRNKSQAYNKGLIQTRYENEMNNAKAKANARAGVASNALAAGQAGAAQAAGIGSAINQGVTAYANQENSNEQRQKDRDAGMRTMGPRSY